MWYNYRRVSYLASGTIGLMTDRSGHGLISPFVVRLLLAAGLVVCPLLRPMPAWSAVLSAPTPASQTSEEEEEKAGGAKSSTVLAAPVRGDRKPPTPSAGPARPATRTFRLSVGPALSRAAFADPFRNGHGCPIRC